MRYPWPWLIGLTVLSMVLALWAGYEHGRRRREPPAPAAGRWLVSTRYGYRVPVPAGWQVADMLGALGGGPEVSPDVVFYPPAGPGAGAAMGVRICPAAGARQGDCLPARSEPTGVRPVRVAGVSGTRHELRRTGPGGEEWREVHTLLERAGETVQVWAAWAAAGPWAAEVPRLYEGMLRGWRWIR